MDVVERQVNSMKKANKHWNIPFSSLCNHLNGKTRCRKFYPLGFIMEENNVVVAWIINMYKCGLFISL
jgi:hypothetical protein